MGIITPSLPFAERRIIEMKRLMKNIFHESKPYDFLLLMVSAIVGFVLSLFGDTNITCVCATVIVVLFMLFWLLYNISENNADYMRTINREFRNEHWYEVLYLAYPICTTLRRMGKYKQLVKVAEKMLDVLNKINHLKIDADCIKVKHTDIEKFREKLMINDLGYSYFMLKDIKKATKYIRAGIAIAKVNKIPYAELKGWTILLQMTLINNYGKFFTYNDTKEIYHNFRKCFDEHWDSLGEGFPTSEPPDYISFLKSFEIETKYKYQRLGTMNKKEFLGVMEKLASGYEKNKFYRKYYDCKKCVFEIKLSDNAFDPNGSAEALLTSIIDGAFDSNVGLTPIQYIKYVTIYLEYCIRVKSVKENGERISRYIKKIEKELWYVEDPCMYKFNESKKKYVKAMKCV